MTGQTARALTEDEIRILESQGCWADDWANVTVSDPFLTSRLHRVGFIGSVSLGSLSDKVTTSASFEKNSGIFNAILANCTVGDQCYIANVGVHIANYNIGNNVVIENIGTMETRKNATFGNGVEVEALNEGGGREVIMFDELNSQFAYLMCVHRYRPELLKKLNAIAEAYVKRVTSDTGKVGDGARVASVTEIVDVNIGENADVSGAASLINGTILSAPDASTRIGGGVVADGFIIAEGSTVSDGVILNQTFIGQGCKVGKQYSAENCLFFANCEAFHGEGVAMFGGPYTVTHHKSTLLIAALTSFYNAGSGTNQSNHMYKLGPVHEGKMERGSKTGSFSYMMWDGAVGPFSVVLGKHKAPFDASDFPFNMIMLDESGKSSMVPGMNMSTVGTVRDGAKWPARDRRKGAVKRDRITFDVFSPFTVGRMLSASEKLTQLQKETDKSVAQVFLNGVYLQRALMRRGVKTYRSGIDMYLLGKVMDRIEPAIDGGFDAVKKALAADENAVYSEDWVDIGGQMMPRARLEELYRVIESGEVDSADAFFAAQDKILAAYDADEWAWVRATYQTVYGRSLDDIGKDDLVKDLKAYEKARVKYLKAVISDAVREYDETSRLGFGQDGSDDDVLVDFTAVRGEMDDNKFVKEMRATLSDVQARVKALVEKLGAM